MKSIIHWSPFCIIIGIAYILSAKIIDFDAYARMAIVTAFSLCIGYFLNWWNIVTTIGFMSKNQQVELIKKQKPISKRTMLLYGYWGHGLIWISAVLIGYGFTLDNTVAMLVGSIFWGIADHLFMEVKKKSKITGNTAIHTLNHILTDQSLHPSTLSLLEALKEHKKDNPFVGVALGAKEINTRLMEAMKNARGVHIESLLCALGALAGYSCQANLRVQAAERGLPETAAMHILEVEAGRKYFFGDALNKLLAESKLSVWNLASLAAKRVGCHHFPDIEAIFTHTIQSMSDDTFGIPRVPDNHRASDTPINYLKVLWPRILPIVKIFCQDSSQWPLLFGVAIQYIIEQGRDIIDPELALTIVMESAIPMSKVDLDSE